MKKAIKIICLVLCAAVLIGLGLYCIPWKTPINVKMHAVVVQDGVVSPGGEIKISGSFEYYLFKRDKMNAEISLGDIQVESQDKITETYFLWPEPSDNPYPYYLGSYGLYSRAANHFVWGPFGISHDLDWLVIRDPQNEERYIVASADPDFDPQEILKAYHEVIHK